jgi:aryl-alcohol dehydrogenase-like predicted oxidoreductase
MNALHDVVQSGLVRYIGMSSCWAWQFQILQRKCRRQPVLDIVKLKSRSRIRSAQQVDPVHLHAESAQRHVP